MPRFLVPPRPRKPHSIRSSPRYSETKIKTIFSLSVCWHCDCFVLDQRSCWINFLFSARIVHIINMDMMSCARAYILSYNIAWNKSEIWIALNTNKQWRNQTRCLWSRSTMPRDRDNSLEGFKKRKPIKWGRGCSDGLQYGRSVGVQLKDHRLLTITTRPLEWISILRSAFLLIRNGKWPCVICLVQRNLLSSLIQADHITYSVYFCWLELRLGLGPGSDYCSFWTSWCKLMSFLGEEMKWSLFENKKVWEQMSWRCVDI